LEKLLPSIRRTYNGDILIANYNDFGEEGKQQLSQFRVMIIDVESKSASIVIDRYRVFTEWLRVHMNEYDTVMHLDGCDMVVNDINPLLSRSEKGLTIFEDGGLWKNDRVIREDLWHINGHIPESDWKLVENRSIFNPSLCGGPLSAMYNLFYLISDYCKRYGTEFGMDLYAVNIVMRAHSISFTPIPLVDNSVEHYGGYNDFKFRSLKESKDRREGRA
jgi:hypothetical protein